MAEIRPLALEGLVELRPDRRWDERGFFSETWSRAGDRAAGLMHEWVQENHSMSASKGVLRGLHYQLPPAAQAKLVRVVRGSVFDVAVDIRRDSTSFGRWAGLILSADQWNQVAIDVGFAHGFVTLEEDVEVQYKVSASYRPDLERVIRFDDPALAIDWPLPVATALMTAKDAMAPPLALADIPNAWL